MVSKCVLTVVFLVLIENLLLSNSSSFRVALGVWLSIYVCLLCIYSNAKSFSEMLVNAYLFFTLARTSGLEDANGFLFNFTLCLNASKIKV